MMKQAIKPLFLLLPILLVAGGSFILAQQLSDDEYNPEVTDPAWPEGEGPVVGIDEAHGNFHTAEGRYAPFARLLGRDGYVVTSFDQAFSAESLAGLKILVISNPLAERNLEDWSLPTPSAFTGEEMDAVVAWVDKGGSLFLVADHMPFPGAAGDLAARFGVTFSNGFAGENKQLGSITFTREAGDLAEHAITRGRNEREQIHSVINFAGSAFRAGETFQPLLTLDETAMSLEPKKAWEFDDDTPRVPVAGWLQGAVARHGQGRIAVFGEAAMFSAQRAGEERRPMGMNAPEAGENPQFLLNVMHWLSGLLDD